MLLGGIAERAEAQVAGASPPPAREGWKLVWSDEFDGAVLDKSKWDHDLGNGFFNYDANTWISGWGNEELQYYTTSPDNVFLADGNLHIRAVKESYLGCGYTSAKLKSRKRDGTSLFAKRYGRFEWRAQLPVGRGVWPALWMLPQEDKYGTWAASGEIDVLEAKGQEPDRIHGTLHFGSRWPANAYKGKEYVLPEGRTIAEMHTYAVEWEPGEIRWYCDDVLHQTQSSWWSSNKQDGNKGAKPTKEAELNPWPAPFDQPFYLVMNVAVGGRFLGKPDATTKFPAEMVVDYVRVYDRTEPYGEPKPRGTETLPFGSR
ncbi:MAG: glycoside hydrolase family 16 protein [Planctomycetia bacterium]|nr:glycoside hydrolase family 16 protein [Planctomycetia bacterium]